VDRIVTDGWPGSVIEQLNSFNTKGRGPAIMMGTRQQTSYGLADSPGGRSPAVGTNVFEESSKSKGGLMATTKVATSPMKVAQIPKPGTDFQIAEREIPTPDTGHVRIKVQACGVCHSDVLTKDGLWPGIQYPRVPGHEVVGIIDEVGAGVSEWTMGQRVGVGWHGGHDGTCIACRRGDFGNCRNMKIAGISYDGGYQQYMVAPVEALVAIPESLNDTEAAPLLCAGITTFNALRHSGAFPGDLGSRSNDL